MATMSIGDASDSQVSVLHRISNIVSSDLTLDEMLGEVVGLTVQATACDACLVYLIEHETHDIILKASQCRTRRPWTICASNPARA